MTESEQDKAIRDLASALDRLQSDYFDLRCCLGATFAASALMIFLVVWFGGVNITIVNEPPRYPANVGEREYFRLSNPERGDGGKVELRQLCDVKKAAI